MIADPMTGAIPLFEVNPELDRPRLKSAFAGTRRVQIRDVLTDRSARTLHQVIAEQTPWGVAWQAGEEGPHSVSHSALKLVPPAERGAISNKVTAAMRGRDYGFVYSQYPMLDAYLQRWAPGGVHDLILEHINDQPFLDLVREVTAFPDLIKADAQATLYGPGQFLSLHDDSHVLEGWRIAYVLNLCAEDWRPDWGGYLLFYDEDGDVVDGFRPRFNALNLFAVPQHHNVSYVPGYAPVARYAITGWFRDV